MTVDFWYEYRNYEDLRKYAFAHCTSISGLKKQIPLESVFQKRIMDKLDEMKRTRLQNMTFWKTGATAVGSHDGVPDILVVIDGQLFAVEVKRPYLGVTSKLQDKFIDDLRAAGVPVVVTPFWEDVDEMFRRYGVYS